MQLESYLDQRIGVTLGKTVVTVTVPALPMTAESALVLSAPVLYALELTPVCNSRCLGCSNVFAHEGVQHSLTAMQWRTILTGLKSHVHHLKLTGGEPTLYPEFETVVVTLDELNVPFSVFTNARWHNPARLIARLQAVSHFRGLLVSLHGATAGSHEAFTCVPGSFAETCANIRRAAVAGMNVTTSTVITGHNWDEVEEIVRLSQRLGANHAVFNRFLGESLPSIEPDGAQLHQAIEAIAGVQRRGGRVKYGNCIPQCFHLSSSTGCLAGVAYCTVDPWGNVRPCNHAPLICGSLLEQPIEEIWHGEIMRRWRGMIVEQCLHCLELQRCHGGCRAVALIQGVAADPLMRSPILEKEPEPPREMILYEGSRPVLECALRTEGFGYLLMRGNRILPVATEAKPLLDACDGNMSLMQLQERFGQNALDFVGSLVEKGLVDLR